MRGMKENTRIRFKVVNYGQGKQRIKETGEEAEGTIIRSDGDGYAVHVEGVELPYYVEPKDIIRDKED